LTPFQAILAQNKAKNETFLNRTFSH